MKAEIVIPLLVAAIASAFFYSAVGQDFAQNPGVRDAAPGGGHPNGQAAHQPRRSP